MGPVFFQLLENHFFSQKGLKGRCKKPGDLDIVLCSTHPKKQYTENILEYLGMDDFAVLGRDLKTWKHIYKIKLIVEHIKKHPYPGLLLHLDAPDVLVIDDLQPAVDRFNSDFQCDLLFGAEKNSAPGSKTTRGINESEVRFLSRIEQFEEASYDPPFRYLNAGCFIGRKEYILELFSEALDIRKHLQLSSRLHHGDYMYDDDQLILRELHRRHYPRIQIDHGNKVFQNLYAIQRSEISANHRVPSGAKFLTAYAGHLALIMSGKIKRRLLGQP
jgi:hypothetical protein